MTNSMEINGIKITGDNPLNFAPFATEKLFNKGVREIHGSDINYIMSADLLFVDKNFLSISLEDLQKISL